ncbi:MAG: M20/M25/M40 family metallo-hydrolase [Clostridia bacterium]|nr:M20/M25/M40 family metallo-hydrolase [Clostridia bacterium]
MKQLLKKLSLEFGPSGCEDRVREAIKEEIKDYIVGKEAIEDGLGSYIVHMGGNGPRLMISAHMDEVGFMVTGILDNGLLKFGTVGGIDPVCLSSKRVISESGVKGNIISKPIHLLSASERGQAPKMKNLSIDIGANSKDEAQKLTFVGDYFTFDSDYCEYGEGFVKCKALDDRLGCAIMCQLIKDIYNGEIEPKYDLYFAFTTREEIGYSGAYGASMRVRPEYAIILESKAVADIAGVGEESQVATLGDGVIISFADRGTIYDHTFVKHIKAIADKNGIKNQTNRYISGGNDSMHIQKNAEGARVSTLSCASRYIHSQSDVIHMDDFESAYKTVKEVIKNDGSN